MKFAIRPLKLPMDYSRIAELFNSIYFDVNTGDDLENADKHIPLEDNLRTDEYGNITGFCRIRVVAVNENDNVIGFAQAWLAPWFKGGKLSSHVIVDSRFYSHGIGKALYLHLENWARSKNASSIQTELKDHLPYALPFVKELGFAVRKHNRYSSLTMEHVRDEPFKHIFPTFKGQGIQFHTLKDEREKADFDMGKLYELYKTTYTDIPGEEAPQYTYEEWKKKVEQTDPELIIVACDQDRYVGISHLQFRQRGNYLWHEYTGVDRSFRRRNIALALKLLSVEKARQLGAERLITSNSILNEPMINLNNKLGYTRIPGHYVIEKCLTLR